MGWNALRISINPTIPEPQTTFIPLIIPLGNDFSEIAMSKRLVPSMTALQCFEAAARHVAQVEEIAARRPLPLQSGRDSCP